jgi:hypothetical protein
LIVLNDIAARAPAAELDRMTEIRGIEKMRVGGFLIEGDDPPCSLCSLFVGLPASSGIAVQIVARIEAGLRKRDEVASRRDRRLCGGPGFQKILLEGMEIIDGIGIVLNRRDGKGQIKEQHQWEQDQEGAPPATVGQMRSFKTEKEICDAVTVLRPV